jgi:SAM-dependent methyltransferase
VSNGHRPTDEALFELQETLYTSKNPTRRWLHVSRRDWIAAALRRAAPDGRVARALEIGPGSGVYLPVLAEIADEVIAADIEDAYLDRLHPFTNLHPNITLVRDDITRSRFDDATFDLILCTEVIEHIRDSPAALREMRRTLQPGHGRLVLSTPQRYSPLELVARIAFLPGIIDLVRLIYREPVIETGHINLLTARALHAQLEAAGFDVVETHTAGVYLPVVAELFGNAALRVEQALEGRLRGSPLEGLLWTQFVVATPG